MKIDEQMKDHEKRIRFLEKVVYIGQGIVITLQLLIFYYLKFFIK